MSNPWVIHVKKYASDNNLSYGCAMTQPACKASYIKPSVDKKVSKPSTVPKVSTVSKPSTVPKITYEYINMKEPPKDNKIRDEFNYKPVEKFVNTFKPVEKKIEPAIQKQINKDSFEKQVELKNKQKQIEDKYYNFLGELYKIKSILSEEDKKNIEKYREEYKTISGYNLMTFNEFKKKEKMKEPTEKQVKIIKEPVVKPTAKEIEKNFDIVSGDMQKLILLIPLTKIKKALNELNFKGNIQTNKFLLSMQLLQNFNTVSKMEKLINKLNEPDNEIIKTEVKQTPKIMEKLKEPIKILTYNNPSKYLSGYIGINNSSNTFLFNTDSEKKNQIKDKMFDIIDNKFSSSEVNKLVDNLNIDTSAVFDRARNFYDGKIDAGKGVEYTDFVSLVIFPSLVKNTPKKTLTTEDKFILLLYANNIANEAFFSDVKPVNKGSVAMQFLKPKTIGSRIGNYLGKEYQQLIQDFGMS